MRQEFTQFNYFKEGAYTLREVYVLKDSVDYLEGIDVTKLTSVEKSELTAIIEKFEAGIKPFITKSFRRFTKAQIKS